jgi:hypothetical protein
MCRLSSSLHLGFIDSYVSKGNITPMSKPKARQIISDLGKIVNPRGIQETFKTMIGGVEQWIYTRGQDRNNPIILFIHGGPASPMSPVMWMYQRPIEEHTVVNWDQRASGRLIRSRPSFVDNNKHRAICSNN